MGVKVQSGTNKVQMIDKGINTKFKMEDLGIWIFVFNEAYSTSEIYRLNFDFNTSIFLKKIILLTLIIIYIKKGWFSIKKKLSSYRHKINKRCINIYVF